MATPIRSNYAPGAAGDQQYQLALQRNLPTAPSSVSAPVAMPTTQQGQIEQQLKSGVNAGGQALSAVQKASLENQLNQVTGKTTQVQAQANREDATKTALQNSTTINNYAAVTPQSVAKQVELNNKYELAPTTGLYGADPYTDPKRKGPSVNSFEAMRNHEKEAKMAKKLGGLPQTSAELDQFFRATYSAKQLQEMGYVPPPAPQGGSGGPGVQGGTAFNSGAAGSTPVYDQAKLTALGLTPERLDQLIKNKEISPEMLDQLKSSGDAANIAQSNLNATPKPTNSMMATLQEALQAKDNFQNQNLGVSDLFNKVGLSGYAVLGDSLAMRSKEMGQKFQSAASLIQKTGGAMADVYSGMLEQYKATQDAYDKQADRLLKIDESARSHERALELMERRDAMDREMFEFQEETKMKYAQNDPKLQLHFNPITGEEVVFDPSSGQRKNSKSGSDYNPSEDRGYTEINGEAFENGEFDKALGVGTVGDWCGVYASSISTAKPVGDYWASKKKVIDKKDNPKAGDKLLLPLGVKTDSTDYGHVAVVINFDPESGEIDVVESNKDGRQNSGKGKGVVTRGTYNLYELQKQYGEEFGFASGNLKPNIAKALGVSKSKITTEDALAEAQRRGVSGDDRKAFIQSSVNTGKYPPMLSKKEETDRIDKASKSDDYKKIKAQNKFLTSLQGYYELVNGAKDFVTTGVEKSKLDAAYNDLKLEFKNAKELGAITSPDVPLIEGAIRPISGNIWDVGAYGSYTIGGGKEGVQESLKVALQRAQTNKQDALNSFSQIYGDLKGTSFYDDLVGSSNKSSQQVKVKYQGKIYFMSPEDAQAAESEGAQIL